MSDIMFQILKLLDEDCTINEMSDILSISSKKIYYYLMLLKNKGYLLNKKYYYDGNVKYNLQYSLDNCSDIGIITPSDLEKIDFLIVSDIHLSSSRERLDLLDKAYDYCINKNIHLVLAIGDIIDGFVGNIPKKYNTSYEQIDYAVKYYPYDKNILNFLVLGNHDYSTIALYGQDLKSVIENKRSDIVVTGYGEGKLYIKNDVIVLRHPLKFVDEKNESYNKTLIIKGHTHHMKTWSDYNNFIIYAPTLSDINSDDILPGMIHMSLNFLHGYIQKCYLKHLTYINNKFYMTGESTVYLTNGKPFKKTETILYEENLPKILKK